MDTKSISYRNDKVIKYILTWRRPTVSVHGERSALLARDRLEARLLALKSTAVALPREGQRQRPLRQPLRQEFATPPWAPRRRFMRHDERDARPHWLPTHVARTRQPEGARDLYPTQRPFWAPNISKNRHSLTGDTSTQPDVHSSINRVVFWYLL